ncbi:MAG: hypothetical protein CME63_12930 [Halobacteriovoraceae bacterium]|nr:hypothetical protein [Halobacteriovoraceae bacterium]|tara:strand:- start:481 stop:1884 length:1404 start_codon:yes stop_codon:yes gene_type:complete
MKSYKLLNILCFYILTCLSANAVGLQIIDSTDDITYTELKVGYEKFLRLNNPQNKTKNSDWLDFSFQYESKRSFVRSKVDADLRFYINNTSFSPSLSEMYLQYKSTDESRYTFGRIRLDWHPNEAYWQLNHFQNTQGFRLMDTNLEGITGFHYAHKDSVFRLEFFLSYLYIPALNPSVDVENGNVSSNVDWYKQPPKRTIITGSEVDIFYSLDVPEYRDVLFQKSLGLKITPYWGNRQSGGEASFFAIYKPERNLRVNAEAYYDPDINKVAVNANPIVNHHVILGYDLRLHWGQSEMTTGLVYVDPTAKLGKDFESLSVSLDEGNENNRNVLSTEFFKVEPKYMRETYAHLRYNHQWEDLTLSLNGIYYFSKHPKGSDDFYSETVKWVRAAGIGGLYQMNEWSQLGFSLRYDFKRKDNLLNAQYILTPWRSSIFTFGAELIKSPKANSYWSAYRTNDTFYFNAGYTF